jgi:hypothetical protein
LGQLRYHPQNTEHDIFDQEHSHTITASTTRTPESGSKALSKENIDVFNSVNASAVSAGIKRYRNC